MKRSDAASRARSRASVLLGRAPEASSELTAGSAVVNSGARDLRGAPKRA